VKIKGNGKLALALIGEYPAVDAYCCNYPGHTYEFDVSITAANARTRSYTFLFYWTGDRKSSDFTFLEAVSKRVPELENKLGQITLARSGTGIIRTIESRLLDINEFLKKYEPLLEYAYERNSPPNPPPNIPLLHEINDHLIQDCFAVELETGGIAFRELAKLFTEMNREIHVFNDLPTPRGIQRIRKFSEQVIPEVIQRAKNECP